MLHDTRFFEFASLSPVFTQDPVSYIFNAAKTDPEFIAESAVLDTDLVWIMTDGEERELTESEYAQAHWGQAKPPEGSLYEMPVMRPTEVFFFDIVNEGALTNGIMPPDEELKMFSQLFQGHSSEYASQLWSLMDEFISKYNIPLTELPNKANQIIQRYVSARSQKGDQTMAKKRRTNFSKAAHLQDGGDATEVEEPIVEEEEASEAAAPASPDVEEGSVSDDLETVESIHAEIDAEQEETEEVVESTDLAALRDDVLALSHSVASMAQDMKKLSSFLVQQAHKMQALSRNVSRIDGERVMSAKVPRHNVHQQDRLEPIPPVTDTLHGFNPSLDADFEQAYSSMTSMLDGSPESLVLATDSPQTVEQKAIAQQSKRQQRYRMASANNPNRPY